MSNHNHRRAMTARSAVIACLLMALPARADKEDDAYNDAMDAGRKAFTAKEYDDAEARFITASKFAEAFDPRDLRLVQSLDHLALTHVQQKKYDQAEAAYRRSLKIIEEVIGKESQQAAVEWNNLAALEGARNEHAKAETYLLQALAIRTKVLAANDLVIAKTCKDLGHTYLRLDKLPEAEKFYRQALEQIEKVKPDSPAMAEAINDLAQMHELAKQLDKALPLRQQAYALLSAKLGPVHMGTATAAYHLANIHAGLEQFKDAEALFIKAHDIFETLRGKDDLEVGKCAFSLGRLYAAQGKFKEAEPMCKKAIAIFQTKLGPTHPFYAISVLNLAVVYENTGRQTEARKLKELIAKLQGANQNQPK